MYPRVFRVDGTRGLLPRSRVQPNLREERRNGLYLVRVRSHGHAKSSCESKVGEFEVIVSVDQEVLWLQVAMKDAAHVTEQKTENHMVSESLGNVSRRWREDVQKPTLVILIVMGVLFLFALSIYFFRSMSRYSHTR